MKPYINSSNSKEINPTSQQCAQQQHSIQQFPNGLAASNNVNLFASNNKMLKGSDLQSFNQPALSVTDINFNNQSQKPPILQDKYDPNKKPPLIQIAQEHAQSVKVGIDKKHVARPELLKICPCCQRQIEKSQFSINCELSRLSFLGTGIPLYLHFIKICILLAFVHLSSSSIFSIVQNSKGSNCSASVPNSQTNAYNNCYQNWITYFSLGNILNSQADLEIQSILGTVSVFLLILVIHYYRGIARKLINDCEYDIKHLSIADYSIMVTGIDPSKINSNLGETIVSFFENSIQVIFLERVLKVESIDLCFDITLPNRLKSQKAELEKSIKNIKSKMIISDKLQKELEKLNNQVTLINKEINEFEFHSFHRDLKFYQKYFLGKAFISFSTIREKEILLQQTQIPPDYKIWGTKSQIEFTPGNKIIEISQAPNPSEINWDNLHVNRDEYFKKNTAGLIGVCLLSVFFFLIIMIFLLVQYNFLDLNSYDFSSNDNNLTIAMSLCVAFITPILNKLLVYFVRLISRKELHQNKQVEYYQATRNLVKSQIFITCFTTLFIQLVFTKNNFVGRIFNTGGLVHNQQLLVITQSFLLSIFSIFDADSRINNLRRAKIEKCSSHTQINLTQSQLNKLFEEPEIDFMDGYSTSIVIICQALMYSILIPFSVVYAFCGLFLKYIIDKYIILNKRSIVNKQNHYLFFLMIDLLEYVILIYSVANLIFMFYTQSYFIPYASFIGVFLSLVNCWIPSDLVSQKLFKFERKEIVEQPFSVVKQKFPETYHQMNPAFQLFQSSRKDSNNNQKSSRSKIEEQEDVNKKIGSRQHIKNNVPNLDDHQNEIYSLANIKSSPQQTKGQKKVEIQNSNILQKSNKKQNQNIQFTPQKNRAEESQNASANKSIKSLLMIQSQTTLNNSNKENVYKPQQTSQKSDNGQENDRKMINSQVNLSQQLNENHQQNYSLSHMKSKEFQQMKQKQKINDDSFIEEPDIQFNPLKKNYK
ncbi:hypothetical protein ABPG72_000018 [Tetrahymena utriculariae]